jgi:uncharacterized tellurite resistance protein B-like protein
MSINYDDIRYTGDAKDVTELFETYRIENYLDTYEEKQKRGEIGFRERLMKDGIKLTEQLSPRIYKLFRDVCSNLEIKTTEDIFCLPGFDINAFAHVDISESGTYSIIGITAGALEKLEDNELKFILGHELGHFLFGNNRLSALLTNDNNKSSLTVLPPLGESLFLRWRKKAEISADRVGLLSCNDFNSAAKALMKCTFGLSEKNLNLNIDSLLKQIDEIKGHPELISETFSTHPLLPIRLKSLELFSQSAKAKRNGLLSSKNGLDDEKLERSVDDLLLLTRRYPYKPLHKSVMKAISLAGAVTLSIDGEIGDEEIKILIQILHHWFTDEPELEIKTNQEEITKELPGVIEYINAEGDYDDKIFILSRLTDIALADGALLDEEGAVIMQIAKSLNIQEKTAYGILIGAAQSVGFRTDLKLNAIADSLRRNLQIGLK